jgi:hypothetical protein
MSKRDLYSYAALGSLGWAIVGGLGFAVGLDAPEVLVERWLWQSLAMFHFAWALSSGLGERRK